jgi:hypothetical protein
MANARIGKREWLWPALLALLGVAAFLVLSLSGCGLRPLLYNVSVAPARISPNADGHDDVTLITYSLGRSANLSIYFENEKGERFYFRQDRRRSPGTYRVYWGGVIEGESRYENEYTQQIVRRRVLPDGVYTWYVEAVDDRGHSQVASGRLEIVDADTTLPELRNFSVSPREFTPNQDGIDDRVAITYYLTKEANVVVYLLGPEGSPEPQKYPVAEKERDVKPGAVGIHLYDYEGGVDRQAQPPPDGTYKVIAEAEDKVGNMVVVESTLTIKEGGVPRADIVDAEVTFSPTIVPLGGTLYFTATVENFGKVPIRTSGPPPGTQYRSDQNFNTLEWYEEPGVWRFGIDFETNSTGRPYPYRWAVGDESVLTVRVIDGKEYRYLMPGARALITGSIQIVDKPPRNPIYFWGGLIQEEVRIESFNDHVDPQQISIGF